jgi:hypothetical protein
MAYLKRASFLVTVKSPPILKESRKQSRVLRKEARYDKRETDQLGRNNRRMATDFSNPFRVFLGRTTKDTKTHEQQIQRSTLVNAYERVSRTASRHFGKRLLSGVEVQCDAPFSQARKASGW